MCDESIHILLQKDPSSLILLTMRLQAVYITSSGHSYSTLVGSYDSQAFHSEPLLLLNCKADLLNHWQWIPAVHWTWLEELTTMGDTSAVMQISAWHGHAAGGPAYTCTDKERQLSPEMRAAVPGNPLAEEAQ